MENAARFLLWVRVIGGIFERVIFNTVVRECVRHGLPLRVLVEVEIHRRRVLLRTHSMMSVLPE